MYICLEQAISKRLHTLSKQFISLVVEFNQREMILS